jgi:hypothetical protein
MIIVGMVLGAIVTMGISFIVSPKQTDIDENEEDWYI